jgi:cell division septation protein DedD
VDSPAESARLIATADDWVTKTLATKRLKAQSHKPEAAPRLNVDGPPPGPASAEAVLAVPPPPPPPPPPPAIADNQTVSASPLPEPRNAAEWAGSFWQVTGGAGTVNALTRLLKENGFHAVALASAEDNQVRVMVGPYSDARSLDRAKNSLQGAGFHPVRIWENGHQ